MSDLITTDSGLQYEILASGSGATPGPTDTVSAHYHGTFEDGKVFDSSVDRGEPIDLPVDGVIAGWTEALQLMKEGDKWRLIVPPELGYGSNGVGPIPGNTTLVFEVELLVVR
jgi:FKBP-type peptidyl-prolyl cis-trans isomerase FklB|tara:strand:- start:156 stop:494 length:339 start_codon:yes stop_codon:yes gene_type:complete